MFAWELWTCYVNEQSSETFILLCQIQFVSKHSEVIRVVNPHWDSAYKGGSSVMLGHCLGYPP